MLVDSRLARFRTRLRSRLRLAVLLGLVLVTALQAQEIARKVVAKTAPTYPELAKKMHLNGKVKLEVVVSPGGSVTSAKLAGGNPVFEQSAIEAVKQWRFQPAEKETKGFVFVEFTQP